jgi:UDP-glucuronate 4-epimerase
MHYLVTGAAGFIGFHVAERLLAAGHQVTGLDNLNDYYDVNLKLSRLALLQANPAFRFVKGDLADRNLMATLFAEGQFQRVIHLGAQAGVRYSLDNPYAYADANLVGHLNILEGCRQHKIEHLLYASSSSVYGLNRKTPFSTTDSVDHPVSLYAATKKANELMSHSYAHLYGLPCTGLRFFTVYGPWGRPDMALFKFTKAILAGRSDIWYLSIPPFFLLSFRRFYEIGEKDRPQTAGLDKLRYNANHRRWPVASKRGAFESLYRILWRTRRSARSTRS